MEMARAKNIEMPISAAVADVLARTMTLDQAIESLLARPIRAEV
jgi:glycerol-3-phosphate dehydrogenase (NAD(P)+)